LKNKTILSEINLSSIYSNVTEIMKFYIQTRSCFVWIRGWIWESENNVFKEETKSKWGVIWIKQKTI